MRGATQQLLAMNSFACEGIRMRLPVAHALPKTVFDAIRALKTPPPSSKLTTLHRSTGPPWHRGHMRYRTTVAHTCNFRKAH